MQWSDISEAPKNWEGRRVWWWEPGEVTPVIVILPYNLKPEKYPGVQVRLVVRPKAPEVLEEL